MKYYYFDASVLVKAYLWEVGTEDVREVLRDVRTAPPSSTVVTSSIAFVEAVSAVSRRAFAGEITADEAKDVWQRLLSDFGEYTVVEPELALLQGAAGLTRRHRLRALDAIHLATGLTVRADIPVGADFRFASTDRRLNVAATAELFDVFNPDSPVPPGTSTPVTPSE
ncbi:MAG TPA: type II toxin-antitoxin system VapC family toxin [Longimicrobium sp.]